MRRAPIRSARRRRVTAIGALVGVLLVPSVVWADEQEEQEERQRESASRVEELTTELEGISAELAELYTTMESLQTQVSDAEAALEEAEATYTAVEREHQQVVDRLEAAQAEKERIDEEAAEAEAESAETEAAVAALAREMYRSDGESALLVALLQEGNAGIEERASAAQALINSQTRTLNEARESAVVSENQAERQAAVTERIATLEDEAAAKAEEAEEARDAADEQLAELTSLQEQTSQATAQWEEREDEARAQLEQAEEDYQDASEDLARISAENKENNVTFTDSGSGMFGNPISGSLVVTSSFGWRIHPVLGYEKFHSGVDFSSACGDEQYAIRSGVVTKVTVTESGGNVVFINHGVINGHSYTSAHAHLQDVAVTAGQSVSRGTVIGHTGATGYATGCHVHLEITYDGSYVDPMDYL